MADITLCTKTTCAKRDLCERYMTTNINIFRQSYSLFEDCVYPTYKYIREIKNNV